MLVGSTTITQAISDMHHHYCHQIILALNYIPHINLTCDGWTSPNHLSIFGVTVHFFNENFCPFRKNIADSFLQILKTFEITDRIYCITADYAPENLLGCMAHVINLAVKDGLRVFTAKLKPTNFEFLTDNPELEVQTLLEDMGGALGKVHGLGKKYNTAPQFAADI
ncbi:hypothetical protein CROQUDRAFT_658469 [Cronartium quercuum f. sp. fusiforme G11]|uniref:Uncharacterized protein n=1 Tax=Cronartium quercuum f. sp. fusiforme G11 TaxID=708437 RepID=A0A9P6NK01_9BASI|nr:hypothetical protein CROQUDRAFT_658469 [Cronartium quercuum f. sp. fusiforme G11]